MTIGAIITSVLKGSVSTPPHEALSGGLKVPVGWKEHCSRQSSAPESGVPASAAQVGGLGRHLPFRRGAPPWQEASGTPASAPLSPREYSQYSLALQSLESWQEAPGTTQAWKEQTDPPAQHAAPHASVAAQQTPPAQTPPSPHASPVAHPELWSRNVEPPVAPAAVAGGAGQSSSRRRGCRMRRRCRRSCRCGRAPVLLLPHETAASGASAAVVEIRPG